MSQDVSNKSTGSSTSSTSDTHAAVMSEDTKEQPPGSANGTPLDAAPPQDASEDDRCRLKDLPPELRNDIFQLAVTEPKPIELLFSWHVCNSPITLDSKRYSGGLTGLALTSTCRQFKKEVQSVFYAANTFTLRGEGVRPVPAQGSSSFPLHKINSLSVVLGTRSSLWKDSSIPSEIVIEKTAHKTVSTRFIGVLAKKCTCELVQLARNFTGDDCVAKFVEGVEEQGLWAELRWSLNSQLIWACEVCGKF